jgi:hypothetical protein
MAHSVIITTPRLTLDEIVQQYGLSKADQRFVATLFDAEVSRQPSAYAFKPRAASSGPAKNGRKKAPGMARKSGSRARKTV